jgi:hypothetical protein
MAELPKYKCPADGCEEVLEHPYGWCVSHWRMVPRHMQKTLKDTLIDALVRGTNYRKHQKLYRESIDVVNEKIAAKVA